MSNEIGSCPLCQPARPDLLVAELTYSTVRLNEDQFFPGYCFLVLKEHVKEPHHLSPPVRAAVMEEVFLVAKALESLFGPDKINLESLGNMVPHLHWHVVPRYRSDGLWPRPIWAESHDPQPIATDALAERVRMIQEEIAMITGLK